jgi:hypothetical protein
MYLPLTTLGMIFCAGGFSKDEDRAAITAALGGGCIFEGSGESDLGCSFLTTGGGVERLRSGFSKFAASALNAGDRPLTRTRSGLKDMLLLDLPCALSGTLERPVCDVVCVRLFGF